MTYIYTTLTTLMIYVYIRSQLKWVIISLDTGSKPKYVVLPIPYLQTIQDLFLTRLHIIKCAVQIKMQMYFMLGKSSSSWFQTSVSYHIEAKTGWTPFRRRHFHVHFLQWNCCILIKLSLKYVRKGPIDNNRALVRTTAWRRSGDKPLSEPMMISLPTHMCVTRPQWVND